MTDPPSPESRRPKFRLWMLMLVVAFLAPIFAYVSLMLQSEADELGPSESEIHAVGDRLVSGIEAWRSKHGKYPNSLAQAGLVSPAEYDRYDDEFQYEWNPMGYVLWIGHGGEYGRRKHAFHFWADGKSGWDCQ